MITYQIISKEKMLDAVSQCFFKASEGKWVNSDFINKMLSQLSSKGLHLALLKWKYTESKSLFCFSKLWILKKYLQNFNDNFQS